MASGPRFDKRSGAYSFQWHDGKKWTRTQVYKIPGWKLGMVRPKKDPPHIAAFLTEFAAKERAAKLHSYLDPSQTIAEFLSSFAASHARDTTKGTQKQLDQATRNFLAWCESAKVTRLSDLTKAHCQKFLDKRAGDISQKTGKLITPGRISQERAMLGTAWSRALRLDQIAVNPWIGTTAPGWSKHKKAKVNRPSWTPKEFARLHAASPGWLQDVLTLGTQTGLRINALIHLRWDDVTLSRTDDAFGVITVRPELDKIGRGYRVPLSAKAHDVYARRWQCHSSDFPYILAGRNGLQLKRGMTDRRIRAICKKLKLPDPVSPNHMMRRSFGRWAILGHLRPGHPIPMYVVMKWLGHTNIATTHKYLDLGQEDSQQWMVGDKGSAQTDRDEG